MIISVCPPEYLVKEERTISAIGSASSVVGTRGVK